MMSDKMLYKKIGKELLLMAVLLPAACAFGAAAAVTGLRGWKNRTGRCKIR